MEDIGCKLSGPETPKDIADLFITSTPLSTGVEICISFCTQVICRSVAERILQRLCSSFQFLSSDVYAPLESVSAGNWDVPCIPWPLASRDDDDIQRPMFRSVSFSTLRECAIACATRLEFYCQDHSSWGEICRCSLLRSLWRSSPGSSVRRLLLPGGHSRDDGGYH